MADQRRSQCTRHGRRRARGLGGLGPVLLALSLTLAACETGTPSRRTTCPIPVATPAPPGEAASSNAAILIVGTWETTVITPLAMGDYLTTKTTWIFRDTGACLQTIESTVFSEGVTNTTSTACTYTLGQGVVLVLYTGAALQTSYPFSFPLNDPDHLILSGITYDRVS